MQIIQERPQDAAAVEALNDTAFGPNRYIKTVYRLRANVAPIPELCFVALDEQGELLASLRNWPIVIGPNATPAVLLGPLAVRGDLRGRGHGKALMAHGIAVARQLGHRIIILVGDPEYYQQWGFLRELTRSLALPGPVEERRFLGLELVPGALTGIAGMIRKAPEDLVTAPRRRVRLAYG